MGPAFLKMSMQNCIDTCLADVKHNGICDVNEPLGCTYPLAINYDEEEERG